MSAGTPSNGHANSRRVRSLGRWLPAAVLILAVVLAYWPGRNGGYVFDDFPNIVDNVALHVDTLDLPAWLAALFSSPATDLQRPLAMLTLALNHYFTGLDPVPMKLTNIAIHALNALLVLGLARQLLAMASPTGLGPRQREWAARFVAAAWALHPINLMAVLFVVQRMESLSHSFVFVGLWLYLLGRQRQQAGGNGWGLILIGLLGGTGLGVLAKESAILLPLYAFCVELCLFNFRGGGGHRDRRLHAMFAVLLFVPALVGLAWLWPKVTAAGAYANRNFSLDERLLTEGRVVLDYLRWTLFPSLRGLSLYHDDFVVSRGLQDPPMTSFALLALTALAAAAVWLRSRRPLASLGLLWFLGAQLLTATIIPLELAFEHRNYFASLGVCLVLADLLLLAPRGDSSRRIGALLAILAVLAFTVITHLRAREWSDPYRFAATEAAKHPQSPRATYALGHTLTIMSGYRPESALLPAAKQALEHARQVPHAGILPHSALLILAARTGEPSDPALWQEIRAHLQRAPASPQDINAIISLASCARDGDCAFPVASLKATFDAALLQSRHPDLLAAYGDYLLRITGDSAVPMQLWREAVVRQPTTAQYRINLIKLLIARGEREEAARQIAELRTLGRLGQNEAAAIALQERMDASSGHGETEGVPR